MSDSTPPLVALRIPAGWIVRYNQLREIAPESLRPTDPLWVCMNEDLLQLESSTENLLIDVGWYPDNDPQGHFAIKCVFETDWARPVSSITAVHLSELVSRLEAVLATPPQFPLERLLERLTTGLSEERCVAAEALAERGEIEAIDALTAAMNNEHLDAAYERLGDARRRLTQLRVMRSSQVAGDEDPTESK